MLVESISCDGSGILVDGLVLAYSVDGKLDLSFQSSDKRATAVY